MDFIGPAGSTVGHSVILFPKPFLLLFRFIFLSESWITITCTGGLLLMYHNLLGERYINFDPKFLKSLIDHFISTEEIRL